MIDLKNLYTRSANNVHGLEVIKRIAGGKK
jgi:hypothetical protein